MNLLQIVNLVGLWLAVGLCLMLILGLQKKLTYQGLLEPYLPKLDPGQLMPDLALRTLDNKQTTQNDLLGKEHLLFFVIPGCHMCAEQIPKIKELIPTVRAKGVEVKLVCDGAVSSVIEYTKNFQLDVEILATDQAPESTEHTSKSRGTPDSIEDTLRFSGFPRFFWLDADNKILASGGLVDDAVWETVQLIFHRR